VNGLRLGVAHGDDGEAELYLSELERSSHLYVIGSTGVGKSKALADWALHELREGYGFGIIDPHGDLVADVLANATAWPIIRLIEFDAAEMVTLNPLERVPGVTSSPRRLSWSTPSGRSGSSPTRRLRAYSKSYVTVSGR
jgi:DNA helicase HerA-like ATPase